MVRSARSALAGLTRLPAVARPAPRAVRDAARTTPADASRLGGFAEPGLSRRHYARVLYNAERETRGRAPAANVPGSPRIGASGDHIKAAVVLSRAPVVTRTLTDFEQAYFAYRDAVRLYNAAPFGTEFYFKKRTSSERRFLADYDERMKHAFQVAASAGSELEYSAPWRAPLDDVTAEQLAKEDEAADRASHYVAEPRVTEADRKGDVKSLNRALENTIYLIVKKDRKEHKWAFPQGAVEYGESLVEAAERELVEECGEFIDSWFVGRIPMGHYRYTYPPAFVKESAPCAKGAKVFFMKAHIFSGRVQLNDKEVMDHAWVTKDELQKYVEPDYYKAVVDLLADR